MSVKCLLIKPCSISELDYNDPNYLKNILSLIEEIDYLNNPENNFVNFLSNFLELENHSTNNTMNIDIKNDIFEEEPNYIYNLIYIGSIVDKSEKEDVQELTKNEIAMLINKDETIIYGNAIIIKEYIPSLSLDVKFIDMTINNIEQLLFNRKFRKIVIWDDSNMKWQQDTLFDLHSYVKKFFDEEEPEVKHIEFLMHNLHIFYIESKYGNKYVCGRLLNDALIEKCLIMTMKSEDHIGNISLDEVTKMIKISEKIDKYIVPGEFAEDDITKSGRIIKNNKYKILDKVFNKYY